jgi:uncharacterized peroxidase-related enzyme
VPNYAKVFSLRPAVYQAWAALNAAIKAGMDPRRYELVTLAAAGQLRSSFCSLAHGRVLAGAGMPADQVVAAATDRATAGLSASELAAMTLAERVANDATSIRAADLDELREIGLSDADILDVVVTAAARCFFSKALDALGAMPDRAFHDLDQALRDALTFDRPIEADVEPPA